LDGDRSRQIYPSIDKASPSALIRGPDSNPQSNHWRIKGRDQGVSSGTSYRINFELVGDRMAISWNVDDSIGVGKISTHTYGLRLAYNAALQDMRRCDDAEGCYETTVTIKNPNGYESFNFIRDGDVKQIIYPAENASVLDTGVPVLGPGAAERGTKWVLYGNYFEEFKVRLSVANGAIRVMARNLSDNSEAVWESPVETAYYVKGSFNDWTPLAMVPEVRATNLFRYHVTLNNEDGEEFEIVTDRNGSGLSMLMLTDEASSDTLSVSERFQIKGKRNTTWDIFLDLNQDDRQRQIYWRQSTAREQHLMQV
jgi:hypothetical protein